MKYPFRLLIVLTVALAACGTTDNTAGKRVALQTVALADPAELSTSFTTAVGWNVHLDEAAVALGSLYYFDGEPAFVQAAPSKRSLGERLASLFIGTAYAHPGHYVAGNALGQMLEPGSVDLFAAQTTLGTGDGVTGTYRSARFAFAESASGSAAKQLSGHIAVASGTAVKAIAPDSDPIHFSVFADYADVAKSVSKGEVDGCVFETADVRDDGTVTLTFEPKVWFDLVDFSKVDPGSADAPTPIPHGDIAQIGFALGLVQLTAYHFAYSK